jgi:diacylglycerol O-acyltransferase / wax synthase
VMTQYTMLLMAPTLLTLLSGIGGRLPPMFNITISNVPGPEKPLYFRGAELLSIYPASIVTHGQALNITCESYAGYMNFGFTACHTSLPSMQKLAVYTGEALQELEGLLGLASAPKKAAVKRAATKPAPKATRQAAQKPVRKPAPTKKSAKAAKA